MPKLNTSLHLDMLSRFKIGKSLPRRVFNAVRKELFAKEIYGLTWGDPDHVAPLKFIRDKYVFPYINAKHFALEIGPGGGRWTRYLTGFERLYVVDYHNDLLEELKRNVQLPHMVFVKNNGADFPGVENHSIDYLFSFGTFVHLDQDIIAAYLLNMKPILRPGANIVIQYSDQTKVMAQMNSGFSDTTPDVMRRMVLEAGFRILDEDLTTMWHSSIVHFTTI